jgi:DnaJ like chaperone protein
VSGIELAVVVFCAAAGYWVVSFFLGKRNSAKLPVREHAESGPRGATNAAGTTFTSSKPAPPPPSPDLVWHQVLQLPPSASVQEIRSTYRTLISQYHPDKVASLGTELRALAERKAKDITVAYREAMRIRGGGS